MLELREIPVHVSACGSWASVSAERLEASDRKRIRKALMLAACYGGIDGDHHKAWVIDQMVRALTGPTYRQWVRNQRDGEDGPDTYEWSEGIAP